MGRQGNGSGLCGKNAIKDIYSGGAYEEKEYKQHGNRNVYRSGDRYSGWNSNQQHFPVDAGGAVSRYVSWSFFWKRRRRGVGLDRDREELLEELRTYYGTAAVNGFDMAEMDLYALDSMNDEELEELAEELGL